MELCKHVQTKFVPAGAILFRPGFKDDSIYVVRNGRLKVYIIEPVSSLLTFMTTILCILLIIGWHRPSFEGGWSWRQCPQHA